MHGNVIAAISTPPGKGGVAVIRMSGDGAFEIARRVFLPFSGKSLDDYKPRTQIYGYIIYNEEKIDDGMLTHFPAPNSYTGEDTVEISCHGGILVTRTVLEALLAGGAVPAEAGEFTRRAFINGKLSLSEAEAIGTLLEAKSLEQVRLSASPARAKLAEAIDSIRRDLISLMSSIYARIDYPDEDLGEFTDTETLEALTDIRESLVRPSLMLAIALLSLALAGLADSLICSWLVASRSVPIPSASDKESLPFMKARRVNSPASAGVAPAVRSASRTVLVTRMPP